jgi:hypothetical protein
MDIQELKDSSKKIGQLYPILLDNYGRIIDGEHRSKVDPEWRSIKLDYIKTEKDLFIAKIACNTIRRKPSKAEKSEILTKLAEIYLKEGIAVGKIAYSLSEETGMSYRWIAKYLPAKYKNHIRSLAGMKNNFVAQRATNGIESNDPPENIIKICAYKNTNFVNCVLNKRLYNKIERKAEKLETTVTNLLYEAILKILKEKAPKKTKNTDN